MRRATVAFLAVVLAGALALVLTASVKQTSLAFTLGVVGGGVAADLHPGHTVCQTPIDVPAGGAFTKVRVPFGTYRRPGPPVDVALRDASGNVVVARHIPGGYPDITRTPARIVDFGRSISGSGYALCFTNRGVHKVAIYGAGDAASRTSTALLDGKPVGTDLDLVFLRPKRAVGGELGRLLDRAVLFRSPRLSGGVYLALLIALFAVAIGAVAVALRRVD